ELVGDGQDEKNQQSRADQLVEKTGLDEGGERGEGCEDAGRVNELRIDLAECREIIPVDQGGGGEASRGLRDGIRDDLAPREIAEHGESERDRGVEMRAGNFSGN